MNSNKTNNQQHHDSTIIHRYFHSHHKYDGINQSSQKAFSLIEQGSLKIQTEKPFPITPKKIQLKPVRKNNHYFRVNINAIRSQQQKIMTHEQISNKNRRYLESMLHKYRVFEAAAQGQDKSEDNNALVLEIFEKINYYQELLRNSPPRIPASPQEKQFLEQSIFNIRLAHSLSKDDARLKEQARKLNCSLHRKNKYYECLDDIRKKFNSMNQKPIDFNKPIATEASESTRRTVKERHLKPLLRPQYQKGNTYLSYSRRVGIESKEIYQREKGKVNFLKEVVHHWWSDNESHHLPTVQSSLS